VSLMPPFSTDAMSPSRAVVALQRRRRVLNRRRLAGYRLGASTRWQPREEA
jgi:hypothetical protein